MTVHESVAPHCPEIPQKPAIPLEAGIPYDVATTPSERGMRRILIVDDDHSQSEALACHFDGQGFKTMTADNGPDGMRIAHEQQPDLVVVDMRLPGADGISVCHQLNDASDTCDIPVIVFGAMERPDIIRRRRAAGSHYLIRKPYDPGALMMLAEAAMNDGC